jgi:flagellar P-ring protein precursor FlgI
MTTPRRVPPRLVVALIAAVVALLAHTPPAAALSVQELARLKGQGESTVWGLGFVIGLPGTGDPSENLPLARQLAQVLENGGNPIPDIAELAKGKNIAMVMVTATIPKEGARRGDKIDVSVSTWHRAASLEGGRLFLTPLQGPLPGQGVFAFAEGPLVIEAGAKTSGVVRSAATLARDITMEVVQGDEVALLVEPAYAGWTTTQLIASLINAERQGLDDRAEPIAFALDEREVRIKIPREEQADPANFIGSLMEMRLDPSLLALPARVIVNERKGTIVITGDAEISPAVISHRDMVITTLVPPREPTPEQPQVQRSHWASVGTIGEGPKAAKVQDLLNSLRTLDIPAEDQIAILSKLHKIGRLHAEFVVE